MTKDPREKRTILTRAVPSIGQQMIRSHELTPLAERPPGTINFTCSAVDMDLIARIVMRIAEIAKDRGFVPEAGYYFDPIIAAADIASVHCNGCPLRLYAWIMSEPTDFMEDYAGIVRHVNREAGGINGEWRPRFAETKQ